MNDEGIEYNENQDDYDREKTVAVLTGLVCCLVSVGGTCLAVYHAKLVIGILAAAMAGASFGIADLVVYWAARIDYKEDGTPLEWCSWGVKYGLSFFLLFAGGCVAYELYTTGATQIARDGTMKRAKETFNDCVKNGGRQTICQKQFDALVKTESAQNETEASNNAKGNDWVKDIINWPLFNYVGGILGLVGMVAITLTMKLSKKQRRKKVDSLPDASFTFGTRTRRANFTTQSQPKLTPTGRTFSSVSNGVQSFRFNPSRRKYSLCWRDNGQEKYCWLVDEAEATRLSAFKYKALAKFVCETLEAENKKPQLVARIRATI